MQLSLQCPAIELSAQSEMNGLKECRFSAFVVANNDVEMGIELDCGVAKAPIVSDCHLRNVHGACSNAIAAGAPFLYPFLPLQRDILRKCGGLVREKRFKISRLRVPY
jgi:hypothetical protein